MHMAIFNLERVKVIFGSFRALITKLAHHNSKTADRRMTWTRLRHISSSHKGTI